MSYIHTMREHAALYARADVLTRVHSAFKSFSDLLTCHRNYRPTLCRDLPETRELAALYDAAQEMRGDHRRAFMSGQGRKVGSLIDPRNWVQEDAWYALGDRRAFWDTHTKQWICTTVCERGYQVGAAEFYRNSHALLYNELAY